MAYRNEVVRECIAAAEAELRKCEREMEEKDRLHGPAIERVGQAVRMPRVRRAAYYAQDRLIVVAALTRLLEPANAGEGDG